MQCASHSNNYPRTGFNLISVTENSRHVSRYDSFLWTDEWLLMYSTSLMGGSNHTHTGLAAREKKRKEKRRLSP
ncbi:hypothetical protein OIDMADRAFT_16443, partial [Oidiodendron maius Zn]